MSCNLLLVDDEESLVRAFEKLARRHQLNLRVARSGFEAIELLGSEPVDVALLDLNVAGLSGLQVLEYIKKNQLEVEAIVITGAGSIETAVSSLKMGAYDYLVKPFEDMDLVAALIQKAKEKVDLIRRLKKLEHQEAGKGAGIEMYSSLVGRSQKMREVYELVESVAPSESSILIMGESGTGKELVARAIHEKSFRAKKPFVTINCAALPETLLESELFGHVRGSFTGAVNDKRGLFEEADGGTLFLDEVGEIPPSMQVKLLRVLQDGELRRIGGAEVSHVNVRVLSATNKELYRMVRENLFREDLFYRLNVITVTLPPLREKKEDIPILAYYFLKRYAEKTGKKVERITLDALQALQEFDWPGNVRELENVIERALVLTESDQISARELPPKILGGGFYAPETSESEDITKMPYHKAKDKALLLFNRSYLSHLLRITDGNISLASIRAGMDRSNFKKIIKRCNLNVREFKRSKGG